MALIRFDMKESFAAASAKSFITDLVAICIKAQRCSESPGPSIDKHFAFLLQDIFHFEGFTKLSLAVRDDFLLWMQINCLRPLSQIGTASRVALTHAQADACASLPGQSQV